MDKKMRQVNLSLLEVEQVFSKFLDGPRRSFASTQGVRRGPWLKNFFQYYNKQKARHSASFIGTSISEKPEDGNFSLIKTGTPWDDL